MSTIETAATALPVLVQSRTQAAAKYARPNAPVVPPGSVAGRSLTLVIAIMCLLASLTAGGVYLIFQAANVWTTNIASEITVQVQGRGDDIGDKRIGEIAKFLGDQNGVKHVDIFSHEQSLKLVEPWIGKSEVLKSFAVPRLIAVEINRDSPPELPTLKKVLESKYTGALLDDHGLWRTEIRRLTRFMEFAGLAVILLMVAATVAVVTAATRSALASNREIVEVLNFVGAEEKFIARQFETHFLKVGIRAGLIGTGFAALAFFLIPYVTEGLSGSVASDAEVKRLVGAGTLDFGGYLILVTIVILVAALCKTTSRYGVRRILNQNQI